MKKGKLRFLIIFILCFSFASSQNSVQNTQTEKDKVNVKNFPDDKRVDITVGGILFTSYCYADTSEKPF